MLRDLTVVAIGDGMATRDVAVIGRRRGCQSLRRSVGRTGDDDHRWAHRSIAPTRRKHRRSRVKAWPKRPNPNRPTVFERRETPKQKIVPNAPRQQTVPYQL